MAFSWRHLSFALSVGLGAGACHIVFGFDEIVVGDANSGGANAGGANAGGASAGGANAGGTSPGGSGGVGGTGGMGGTGGQMCIDGDCVGATSDCRAPGCVGEVCGFIDAVEGTACADGDLNAAVCDGAGTCVLCNNSADCTFDGSLTICSNNTCVNAACGNGTIDGTETGSNDGNGMECGGAVCAPCREAEGCNLGSDCLSLVCDTTGGGGGAGAGTCQNCSANSDCIAAQWCDSTNNGGRCAADKGSGLGNACNVGTFVGDAQCGGNSNCVDGFCCNASCGLTCESCKLPGSLSVCTLVPSGADPDNECTANAPSCTAATCSGSDTACGAAANTVICYVGSGDSCDPDISCGGVTPGASCPPRQTNTNRCYAGSGDMCDPDVFCTGTPGEICPPSMTLGMSMQCRMPVNGCDLPEFCTGVPGVSCPNDQFVPAGDNSSPTFQCGAGCCVGASPTCGTSNCNTGERCDSNNDCIAGCTGGICT